MHTTRKKIRVRKAPGRGTSKKISGGERNNLMRENLKDNAEHVAKEQKGKSPVQKDKRGKDGNLGKGT